MEEVNMVAGVLVAAAALVQQGRDRRQAAAVAGGSRSTSVTTPWAIDHVQKAKVGIKLSARAYVGVCEADVRAHVQNSGSRPHTLTMA